jgi:asparagine synthase (glutamine-hydrolysing)
MCGFVGSLAPPGRVANESMQRATAILAHRGPDDSGAACLTGPAWELKLGFRRLAILDLSAAGHQPMADPESGNWIVFNGEIYNFRTIREVLQAEGIPCTTHCDTEVLLKAYRKWGIECLQRLRGMFAFALWDCREQHLLLARDRLGVKPLYYHHAGDVLLFASELRALLATGLVEKRINDAGLVQYLSFGSVYDPETIISGIRSLRPGHYAICREGRVLERQYWTLPRCPCSLTRPNETEVHEQLHVLLREATELRMISDVPVSIFLSGGIDSSALVSLVYESGRTDFHTFSVVFPEAAYSEAPYSRAVAQRFGTAHREVLVTEADALRHVLPAVACMDQPTIDGVNTYIISGAVRWHGFKVALSGIGADESFAGYSTFTSVPAIARFLKVSHRVPNPLRAMAARAVSLAWPRTDRARKLHMMLDTEGALAAAYAVARGLFPPAQREQLVSEISRETVQRALQPLQQSAEEAAALDPINQVCYLELRNYLGNTLVRDADIMGMAHGLEIRQPYLDHKLIEYLFSLPGHYKRGRKASKWLLTHSLREPLPPKITRRPKRGFILPFDRWLRTRMRDEVESVLHAEDPAADFLRPAAVNAVWQDFLLGRTSWSRPWALYVLKRWESTLRS